MSDEKPRWAKVPGEFVERGGGLSFRAWRMYVALALFANRSGQAWPSHSTLRRLLGRNEWSRWQVRDAIRELKEAGWLEAEGSRRESDGGKRFEHLPPAASAVASWHARERKFCRPR